jgi:hypothetical protein
MQFSDQPLTQFAVLILTGAVLSLVTAPLMVNYRDFLGRYAHRLWQMYQRPFYRGLALTRWQRRYSSNEVRIRRTVRVVAAGGFAMGIFFIAIEVAAAVIGHVR